MTSAPPPPNPDQNSPRSPATAFDRPVVLKQSPIWAQLITVTIVSVTAIFIGWAYFAEIEEAIPALGKLEPQGAVQPVQAPVGGVVEKVHVKEGQRVKRGEVLVTFDQTAAKAQQKSQTEIRESLIAENDFYRAQMQGLVVDTPIEDFRFASLAASRNSYVAENRLFNAQLNGGGNLTAAQQARLQTSQAELNSLLTANRLEVQQLERELSRVRVQLQGAREQLKTEIGLVNRIKPLVDDGAIAEVQLIQQQQRVDESQTNLNALQEDEKRLKAAIAQAQVQTQSTVLDNRDQLYTSIATNEQRIADIDSQLTKAIVENEKQIADIDSELEQLKQTLSYQALQAPKGGVIFDLQLVGPGAVTSSTEPIMQIVPADNLMAEVFVSNQDIGFIKEDMEVDVRIDAYSYSEFGDIDGKIIRIGSDALPPDEVYNFYRFPVTIELADQTLDVDDRSFPLQSGMSVNANIKTRKRRIITIFTDLFVRKVDTIKQGG